MDDISFIRKSLFVLGGLLIWAAHFGFVYVFNALACARGFQGLRLFGFGAVPVTIGLATTIAAVAVLALLIIALRAPGRVNAMHGPSADFLRHLSTAVSLLSLVAIGWTSLPALLVPPCG